MTYAAKQDLIDRYGEGELTRLTDTTNKPPSAIDDTMVEQALDDADGIINGYLKSAGLSVPLVPAPSVLIAKAAILARYFLHRDKSTEKVRTDYEDAISWLKDVANGRVALGDVASAAAAPSVGRPQFTGAGRVFTAQTLRDL